MNLTLPLTTWLGWTQTPGQVPGFGPLDAQDSRTLAAMLARHPGTQWCLTLTNQEGHAVAHGCAPGSPGPPPGSTGHPPGGKAPPARGGGQPGAHPLDTWLSRMTVHSLTGPCDHAYATPGYQPSRKLRHLARIRHQSCTRPGCRRPVGQCDLDHTVPYDRGGLTCLCNIGPACRRDHHCKQAPGWTLTQATPGYLTWTTPAGRAYTTGPTIYLA